MMKTIKRKTGTNAKFFEIVQTGKTLDQIKEENRAFLREGVENNDAFIWATPYDRVTKGYWLEWEIKTLEDDFDYIYTI